MRTHRIRTGLWAAAVLCAAGAAALAKEEVRQVARPPVAVRFEIPQTVEAGKPAQIFLIVESRPELWPDKLESQPAAELLLRLPEGIQLHTVGWNPKEIPAGEAEDPSGPWRLFERRVPLTLEAGAPPAVLAREPLELEVVEDGINWVITGRARLVAGTESWLAFGTLFATRKEGRAEFHEVPKTLKDLSRDAQTH